MIVVVPRTMAMAMPQPGIGAGLRLKGSLQALHLQAALAQQPSQNAVLQQHQLISVQFHRHMAIAEVVSRLQEGQRLSAADAHHRLGSRHHQHLGGTRGAQQAVAGLQGLTAGQLQQQVTAARTAAMPPQAGALIGRERQLQAGGRRVMRQRLSARPSRQPLHQQQWLGGLPRSPRLSSRRLSSHRLGSHRLSSRQRRIACAAAGLAQRPGRPRVTVRSVGASLPAATAHRVQQPTPRSSTNAPAPWRAEAQLRFQRRGATTIHQGGASAPLKLQRAFPQASGHCELPLLHTAGGLVGGDALRLTADLSPGSRALLTSVAAQKVYGTVQRSRLRPSGSWALQELQFKLAAGSDLEWLPQELVLYADGLFEQRTQVDLAADASFLSAEVVRLGRTAAGEGLAAGRWRSALDIRRRRNDGSSGRWELVDRLELGGDSLDGSHGLDGQPVFGSLVWAAPQPLLSDTLARLLADCRADRHDLVGEMACGALEQGLVARYRGPSSQAARHWFSRIWRRTRNLRQLAEPQLPRVWPFQEDPFSRREATASGDSTTHGGTGGSR